MKPFVYFLSLSMLCEAMAQTTPTTPATPPLPVQPGIPTPPATPNANNSGNPVDPNQRRAPVDFNRTVSPSPNGVFPAQNGNVQNGNQNQNNQVQPGAFGGFTNAFGQNNSGFGQNNSGFGQNFNVANLQDSLLNLQVTLEQTLPALMNLTRGVDVSGVPGSAAGAQNQSLSTASRANQQLLALQQGRGAGQNVLGTVGTNTVTMNPETFRMLVVLQNDLQQALPVLQALNNPSSINGAGVQVPLMFSNRLIVLPNGTFQNRPGVLTPTGR